MMKIGHGNRIEMLKFAEEVKSDLAKGNFNLKGKGTYLVYVTAF